MKVPLNFYLFLTCFNFLTLFYPCFGHKLHEDDDIAPCYQAESDTDSLFDLPAPEVMLYRKHFPFFDKFPAYSKFFDKSPYKFHDSKFQSPHKFPEVSTKFSEKYTHKFNDHTSMKEKLWHKEDRKQVKQAVFASKHKIDGRVPFIIDTDIGMFPDDPVALAIMHELQSQGKIHILATVGDTRYESVARNLFVMNSFMNNSNTPIGTTKEPNAYTDPANSQEWTEFVRQEFPSTVESNEQVPDAVSTYRMALSIAPEKSVIILSIGHLTNLANLLNSKSDQFSKQTGRALIRRKVKEVIVMGGQFPDGFEWNFQKDPHSARFFAANWPGRVTFVGSEVGNVTCGTKYQTGKLSIQNPVAAMTLFGHEKYNSYWGCFDAVAALIAGGETVSLYCAIYGNIQIDAQGANHWVHAPKTALRPNAQRYVQLKAGNTDLKTRLFISKRIDDFLPDIL